jgi:hypothetical protein
MKHTKNDLARVIIQALYNLKELPPADDKRVIKTVRYHTVKELEYRHRLALRVIEQMQ